MCANSVPEMTARRLCFEQIACELPLPAKITREDLDHLDALDDYFARFQYLNNNIWPLSDQLKWQLESEHNGGIRQDLLVLYREV